MGKQEKRDKADKKAKVKADKIVEEAVATVKAKRASRNEVSDEERDLANQIKERRDSGMAWWQIAFELGLPGSADNVAQGKSGASRARAIYKKVLGDYPKSQRMRRGNDESQSVASGSRRRNRQGHEVVKAAAGQPVFADDVSDEDVIAAIRGKKIAWDLFTTDPVSGRSEFMMTDEQIVHESAHIEMRRDGDGVRHVTFREGQGNDVPVELRGARGKYRTVYVKSIVKVAGTGRRVQTEEAVAARKERSAQKRARRVSRKAASA